MKRQYFPLEMKKLEKEDRRFLLNRYENETIASLQGSMYNTTMTLSLLALLISGFSLVFLTGLKWFVIVYPIVALVGLVIYIRKYKGSQLGLKFEREKMRLNYDELFKLHLSYASKEKNKK